MKVFGIGLEKTGTTTLGRALEVLGFEKHKGFDMDLTRRMFSEDMETIFKVADEFDNFEHYPWALVYEEAFHRYPDSKFILTKRTTGLRWWNSLCHHARKTGPREERQLLYGHSMPNLFEDEDVAFYENHIKKVRSFFRENGESRLLEVCWAHDDGWNELCDFLGKPVPEQEFPHLNR